MTIATGTILFAVKRERFVVLAADQLWSKMDSDETGEMCKIVTHERFPLAFVTSGIAFLPPDTGPNTPSYLFQVMLDVETEDLFIIPSVKQQIGDRLLSLVRQARKQFFPTDLEKFQKVTVAVAAFKNNAAHLHVLTIDDNVSEPFPNRSRYASGPEAVNAYYDERIERGEDLFGSNLTDPVELASLLRQRVQEGIDYEASINSGTNRHCGGPVDVVIVDSLGCHWVRSSP